MKQVSRVDIAQTRACGMLYSRYINVARHNRDVRVKRSLEFSTSVYHFFRPTWSYAYAHSAFPRSRLIDSLVVGGLESRGSLFAPLLFSYVPVSLPAAPAKARA